MNIRTYLSASVILASIAASLTAAAQDETDALRYSNTAPQGTARSMGIGGAVGALGGDFSSLSVNPAGIGVYRRSEFSFTPSMKINGSTSKYQGNELTDNATRFTVNNLGVVFTSAAQGQRYERSKWKSVSFGIGVNRAADFNQNYTYSGKSNVAKNGSGAEVFSIDANNYPSDTSNINTFAGLGYESYLLDKNSSGQWVPVTFNTGDVNQQRTVQQKGGITDINVSLGGNYMEKLMMGVTLGIPSIVFKRDITYSEADASNNTNNNFDNFQYKESLVTRGTGLNLKLGFIYKPVDAVRIGLAFHTPTYFSLKDVQDASITTNTENFKTELGGDPNPITKIAMDQRTFEYNLWTPWRAVASAVGILGKYGFISADYEYVNYASARYNFDAQYIDQQTSTNNAIKNTYQGASNIRVGLEGRIDVISLRLGFGYYGNPYKDKTTNGDGSRMNLTAGIGFRSDNWFLDLGFVHTIYDQQEQPYALNYANPPLIPTAMTTNNFNNAALTFGVKF